MDFFFRKTEAEKFTESEEIKNMIRKTRYNDEEHCFSVEQIVRTWKIDIEKDYDIACVITGYEGSGKSTFAVLLAETCKKLYGYHYSFPKNPFEFLQALNNESIRLIIVDEAVANLYARNAMSAENKQFVSMLTMCRSKNKIMLFLIPRIRNIDIYLRADRVFQWFEIRERNNETNEGTALFFMRNNNDFASTETFDMRSISFAIKKASDMIFKTRETEAIIRENLFYYVQSYMGHVKYVVNEEIKKITKEYSEQLKKENLRIAEEDLREFYINKAINNLKKKITMITLLKQVSKILNKPYRPVLNDNDIKAYRLLLRLSSDKTYPSYDFTIFKNEDFAPSNFYTQEFIDVLNSKFNTLEKAENDEPITEKTQTI